MPCGGAGFAPNNILIVHLPIDNTYCICYNASINIKERVIKMFKNINKSKNENLNVIYRSDEATRRAIDALYVSKRSRTKTVIAAVVIALLTGLAVGVLAGAKYLNSNNSSSTVRIEVSDSLKAKVQPSK